MGNRECVACSRATEMFLCWECTKTLKSRLDSVKWLASELDLTLARQARVTSPGDRIGGTPEQPLPFQPAAGDTAWVLHNTLSTWARDLCETRGITYLPLGYLPPLPPGFMGPLRRGERFEHHVQPDFIDSTSGIAAWLAHYVTAISGSESAGECFEEISAAVAAAHRAIDRPPGRMYIGPCREELSGIYCEADIYVTIGHAEARCPMCGTTHMVEERRDMLREQVRGILGTAAELSRLLPWIVDSPITRKRITYYERIKAIMPRNVNGEKMYQVGEVIDAHVQFELRHAAA
ncbi:hypothetical protein LTT66_18215 [Nocardia gipuzkoensis]|uniref:hypothetical protein n=1 Tax=Nocardia gipuzkoensis TaxID=2749991 RepID=UPI001E450FA7|nr:hypothetical protein [Nocardia gipuzkoensis]UGT65305.1 hypothetical protein LTT66_18215 [Nocardia gipuzkoensis]